MAYIDIETFKKEIEEEFQEAKDEGYTRTEMIQEDIRSIMITISAEQEHLRECDRKITEIKKNLYKLQNDNSFDVNKLKIELSELELERSNITTSISKYNLELSGLYVDMDYYSGKISVDDYYNKSAINHNEKYEQKTNLDNRLIYKQKEVYFSKIELAKDMLTKMQNYPPEARSMVRSDLFEYMKEAQEFIENYEDGIEKEQLKEKYNELTKFKSPKYIELLEKNVKVEEKIDDYKKENKKLREQEKELRSKLNTCSSEEKNEILCNLRRIVYEIEANRIEIQNLNNKNEVTNLDMDLVDEYVKDEEYGDKREQLLDRNRKYEDIMTIDLAKKEIPILQDEQSIIMSKTKKGLIAITEAKEKLEEIAKRLKNNLGFLPPEMQASFENEETNGKTR